MEKDEQARNTVILAIQREMSENPGCNMAQMMSDLLKRYDQGDRAALGLAADMARDTLRPRVGIFQKLKNIWVKV
ncbi:MAG: hypothetical protein WA067_01100 [Microgenomates group bacterium]